MINAIVRCACISLCGLGLAFASGSVTLSSLSPFGTQPEGSTSAAQTATLTNGQTTALTITSITVSSNFTKTATTCPLTPSKLAAGGTCAISVAFAPTATGALTGTLTVKDNAGNSPQTDSLSGTGTVPVTVSPTSLAFGKLPLGETSAAMTVTVTNNLPTALTIKNVTVTGDFAVVSNTCSPSVSPSGMCGIDVTFTPQSTGSQKGTLKISDSASTSPQSVTLSGTGTAAALLSISLTPSDASILAGNTQQYTATGTYSNNTNRTLSGLTWTVTPSNLATVSSKGLVTTQNAGQLMVSATLDSITGSTNLTIEPVFVSTGSLNNARYYHSATLLTNGKVLAAGGIGPVPGATGALGELNSAELYNPNTETFSYTGNLNVARDEHSATLLNNGTVLIAGGSGGDNELASAEIYNPATGVFTLTTGSLNTARYEHTATLLPDGTVLIAGGYSGDSVLASAEIYNPTTQTFSYTNGGLNDARFDATATPLGGGLVLIAGGANASGPLSSAEIYNYTNQTFTLTTGSLNTARSGATANMLDTGNVLIADGYNYTTTGPLTSAELYNPSAQTFTVTGSLSSTNWLGAATLLPNGDVLAAGSVLNAAPAEIYNSAAGTFSTSSFLVTPGDLETATLLPNGYVLIAGGVSNSGGEIVLAAAELYESPLPALANLTSITVTPGTPSINVGASQQLTATGNFNGGGTQTLQGVIWTSNNSTVTTVTGDVSNSGVVYGVSTGAAEVTACVATVCGSATVTVTAP